MANGRLLLAVSRLGLLVFVNPLFIARVEKDP